MSESSRLGKGFAAHLFQRFFLSIMEKSRGIRVLSSTESLQE